MEKHIFALDIGTRSVTGILLEKGTDTYRVADYVTKEHTDRSMRDGQIHNVAAVAEVIRNVKEQLEQKIGAPLKKVSVAAAGRSLKTMEASAELELHQHAIRNQETVAHLELSAVQAAQTLLLEKEKEEAGTVYYCVGYSVLHYRLDSELIGSLIDQSGRKASVEVIATFLPKVVVESLLAALSRACLDMESLTLEPIAAIQVLIPESMRRLNVALVDIGAGTSDIAITDRGTVAAYGMVPVAGDEITEAISDQYLLDFPRAEVTKREIVTNGVAMIEDILGFETELTYDMLLSDISESINHLASSIADEILRLNAKPPRAIMLVGGGSLTPKLTEALAGKMGLPANRVAVRGIDAIASLENKEQVPDGPEYVTPIGIAIASTQNPVHYISVEVNGQMLRLFEMKQLTVGDCLIHAGVRLNHYYGKPGLAAMIEWNGKQVSLPGGFGGAPAILLNGNLAGVDSIVKDGDSIQIKQGLDGEDASVTLDELIGETPPASIQFNGKAYSLDSRIYVNGQKKERSYLLKDKDSVVWKQHYTVRDFLDSQGFSAQEEHLPCIIEVNHRQISLQGRKSSIQVNGKVQTPDYRLKTGDTITIQPVQKYIVSDLLHKMDRQQIETVKVTFNGKPVTMNRQLISVRRGSDFLESQEEIFHGDKLEIKEMDHHPLIFQDIFRYIQIDLAKVKGNFKLYKNGEPSSFDSKISDGDRLEIRWA